MRIAQFFDKDCIRLCLIESNRLLPLDFDGDMIDFIESKSKPETVSNPIAFDRVKLAPPVTRPSKIIALGLNYKDHADEGKGKIPDVPLIFAKFPSSIIGHNDQIRWDTNVTQKVDFEAELAVIIGKKVYNLPETEALGAVFGYTCSNDVRALEKIN